MIQSILENEIISNGYSYVTCLKIIKVEEEEGKQKQKPSVTLLYK